MKHVTLSQILGECAGVALGQHMDPERASWFRGMLHNQIANDQDSIRFFEGYEGRGGAWSARAIADKRQRIAVCELALSRIPATLTFRDISDITEYGLTQRLSTLVRVF
jgi:hypothetical protein